MNSDKAKKFRLQLGIIALVLFASVIFSSQAAFAAVPSRNTFQEWTFTSSPGQPGADGLYGPFSPDNGWSNDFGTPQLYVGDGATWGNNSWALRNDEMDIFIQNFPDNSPQSWKEMQVELTWAEGNLSILPDLPVLFTSPQGQIEAGPNLSVPGTNLKTTTYTIRIQPNPLNEWVFIKGDILLSKVSVNTQCIPEPATLGLLIGGGLLALRRGRNKYGKKQITETSGDTNLFKRPGENK